jgi:hypothetical protein
VQAGQQRRREREQASGARGGRGRGGVLHECRVVESKGVDLRVRTRIVRIVRRARRTRGVTDSRTSWLAQRAVGCQTGLLAI